MWWLGFPPLIIFSDFRNVLDAYLLHHVNSTKSELSEILLSECFTKIPSDLDYYSQRLEQRLQQAKLFYSNRKLYTTLYKLIHLATQLKYVKITNQDFKQVLVIYLYFKIYFPK